MLDPGSIFGLRLRSSGMTGDGLMGARDGRVVAAGGRKRTMGCAGLVLDPGSIFGLRLRSSGMTGEMVPVTLRVRAEVGPPAAPFLGPC